MYTKYGILQLTDHDTLQFILDNETDREFASHIELFKYAGGDGRPHMIEWPLKEIRNVLPRRYVLRKTAIEVFLANGKSLLFNFQAVRDRDLMWGWMQKRTKLPIFSQLFLKKPNLGAYVKAT
jgi:hypothetical protein